MKKFWICLAAAVLALQTGCKVTKVERQSIAAPTVTEQVQQTQTSTGTAATQTTTAVNTATATAVLTTAAQTTATVTSTAPPAGAVETNGYHFLYVDENDAASMPAPYNKAAAQAAQVTVGSDGTFTGFGTSVKMNTQYRGEKAYGYTNDWYVIYEEAEMPALPGGAFLEAVDVSHALVSEVAESFHADFGITLDPAYTYVELVDIDLVKRKGYVPYHLTFDAEYFYYRLYN